MSLPRCGPIPQTGPPPCGPLSEFKEKKGVVKLGKKVKEMRARVAAWHNERGLPYAKTPSGLPKCDADTLEETTLTEAKPWLEYGSLEKQGSTYVGKLANGYDKPIHTWFNVLVDSGRTSSRGPNLQNQPRMPGVRECFVARPGYVFATADYDSKEMRTWAQACKTIIGWSHLADKFNEDPDFDPHTALAVEQFITDEVVTYEEGLIRKKIVHPCDDCGRVYEKDSKCTTCKGKGRPDIVKTMRQQAKIPNFGLPGGMGKRGLVKYARSYGATIDDKTAGVWIDAWHRQYAEAEHYFKHVKGVVGQAFGSRGRGVQLFSNRWRGRVSYTEWANSLFQGFAADSAKAALWEVCRRCYTVPSSALYGARIWNFVHDEIIIEVLEERAHDAAMELAAVMVEIAQPWLPDVPLRASAALMRRWYKDAEAVFVDGKLVPWEPNQ